MFIRKKEYNDLYHKIDFLNNRINDTRKIAEEMLTEERKKTMDQQEKVAELRRILRNIHKLIKKERQSQNYGSVENSLNRLESEIEKIEIGE